MINRKIKRTEDFFPVTLSCHRVIVVFIAGVGVIVAGNNKWQLFTVFWASLSEFRQNTVSVVLPLVERDTVACGPRCLSVSFHVARNK